VVLGVVDIHGLRVDERLKGFIRIRKFGKFECHRVFSYLGIATQNKFRVTKRVDGTSGVI
jgi:hypothetical protein